MVTKNFDAWNVEKKYVNDLPPIRFWYEREIWWCWLGVNVGLEQDGVGDEYRRPVLILKGLSAQTCFVIPLTTSTHAHELRPSVGIVEGQQAFALLSQMKVIDTKRLIKKMGMLDTTIFENMRKTIKDML